MGSGCESLIAGNIPSSARQLPILAALYARFSTLFEPIIHHPEEKVNTFFENIRIILSKYPLPSVSCEKKKFPGVTSTGKWGVFCPE